MILLVESLRMWLLVEDMFVEAAHTFVEVHMFEFEYMFEVVHTSVEAVHTSEVDYRFVEVVGHKLASELDRMVAAMSMTSKSKTSKSMTITTISMTTKSMAISVTSKPVTPVAAVAMAEPKASVNINSS